MQAPYEGPFAIVSRDKKTFVIEIRGKHVKVPIDRLKLCYRESDGDFSTTDNHISHGKKQTCQSS